MTFVTFSLTLKVNSAIVSMLVAPRTLQMFPRPDICVWVQNRMHVRLLHFSRTKRQLGLRLAPIHEMQSHKQAGHLQA